MVYIYWLLFSVVWISTILDSPVFCAATIQSTPSESRQGLLLDPFGPSYHLQHHYQHTENISLWQHLGHSITNLENSFGRVSFWQIKTVWNLTLPNRLEAYSAAFDQTTPSLPWSSPILDPQHISKLFANAAHALFHISLSHECYFKSLLQYHCIVMI